MKRLLIGLCALALTACNEEDKNKLLSETPLTNITVPGRSITPSLPETCLTNVNAAPFVAKRTEHTQPSYLPNGSYTAFQQAYCVGSDCSYASPPQPCNGLIGFPGDFSIYADTSATFWNSIPESVVMGYEVSGKLKDNQIVLLSTVTSHQGYSFGYEYLGQHKWRVNFSESCGRIYICHVGDCLK